MCVIFYYKQYKYTFILIIHGNIQLFEFKYKVKNTNKKDLINLLSIYNTIQNLRLFEILNLKN